MSILERFHLYYGHLLLLIGSLISFFLFLYPYRNFLLLDVVFLLVELYILSFIVLDVTAVKRSMEYFLSMYIISFIAIGVLVFVFWSIWIHIILTSVLLLFLVLHTKYGTTSWAQGYGRNYIIFSIGLFALTMTAFFGIFFVDFILSMRGLLKILPPGELSQDKKIDVVIASGLPALGNLVFLVFIIWLFYVHQNLVVPMEGEDIGVKLALYLNLVQKKKYFEFDLGLVVFMLLHIYSIILSVDHTFRAFGKEFVYPLLGTVSWVELSSILFLSYPLIIVPIKDVIDNFVGFYDEVAINNLANVASRAEGHVIIIGHGKIGSTISKHIYKVLEDLGLQEEARFYTSYFKEILISHKLFVITDKLSHLNLHFRYPSGDIWGLIRVEEDKYIPAFIGDGSNIEVLRKFSAERASLIISTIGKEEILNYLINMSKIFGLEDKLLIIRLPSLTRQHTITIIDTLTNSHTFSTITLLANSSSNLFSSIAKYIKMKCCEKEGREFPKVLLISTSEKIAINVRAFLRNMARKFPKELIEENFFILAPFSYFKINAKMIKERKINGVLDKEVLRCGGEFYEVTFFDSMIEHTTGDLRVNFFYSYPNSYCIYSVLKNLKPDVVIVAEDTVDRTLRSISDYMISLAKLRSKEGFEHYSPFTLSIFPTRDEDILNLIEKYYDLILDKDYPKPFKDGHIEGMSEIDGYLFGIISSYLTAFKEENAGFVTLDVLFRDNYTSLLQVLSQIAGLDVHYYSPKEKSGEKKDGSKDSKKDSEGSNKEIEVKLFENISMRPTTEMRDTITLSMEIIDTKVKASNLSDLNHRYKRDIWSVAVTNYVQKSPKYNILKALFSIEPKKDEESLEKITWLKIDDLSPTAETLDTLIKFEDIKRKALLTDYIYINPSFGEDRDIFEPKVEEISKLIYFHQEANKELENRMKMAICDARLYSYPGSLVTALSDINKINVKEGKEVDELIFDIQSLYIKEIPVKLLEEKARNKLRDFKLKNLELHGVIYRKEMALGEAVNTLKRVLLVTKDTLDETLGIEKIREVMPSIQALRIVPLNKNDEWREEVRNFVEHLNDRTRELGIGKYFMTERKDKLIVFYDPLIKRRTKKDENDTLELPYITPGFALFLLEDHPSNPYTSIVPRLMISPSIIKLYSFLKKCSGKNTAIDCIEGKNRFSLVFMSLNRFLNIVEKTGSEPLYIFVPVPIPHKLKAKEVEEAIIPEVYRKRDKAYKIVILPIGIHEILNTIILDIESSNLKKIYSELGVDEEIRSKLLLNQETIGNKIKRIMSFFKSTYRKMRDERIRLHKRREYWPNTATSLEMEVINELSLCDAITLALAEKIFYMPSIMPPDITALPYPTTKRYLHETPHLTAL